MEQNVMAVVMGLVLAGGALFVRSNWAEQLGENGASVRQWVPFGRFVGGVMAVVGGLLAFVGLFWLLQPGPN